MVTQEVAAPTLADLDRKVHLSPLPLVEGHQYRLVRSSFGPNDGIVDSDGDRDRAYIVLRDSVDQLYLIRARAIMSPGADGGMYRDVALECLPIKDK